MLDSVSRLTSEATPGVSFARLKRVIGVTLEWKDINYTGGAVGCGAGACARGSAWVGGSLQDVVGRDLGRTAHRHR